ncbi:MAG: uridine kinase [Sandaracinaceae bacterium]|nr:uridine kinase [Sandaracinaceae bacterium]
MFRPYVIGVAGGSGSGKSTIAKKIAEACGPDVCIIEQDAYYRDRPDLSFEERCNLNFDHPDAIETELLVAHIQALKRGESIQVPIYDFINHKRSQKTRLVQPAPIIVVEGILLFVEPQLRAEFDLKLFIDTDPDIRVFRRIRRDMEKRGRTFEAIRKQYYETVRPMHLQFVEPSKRWADVIIPEGGHNTVALDLVLTKIRAEVVARRAGGIGR